MDTSTRWLIDHPSIDRSDAADGPRDFASIVAKLESLGAQYHVSHEDDLAASVVGRFVVTDDTDPIELYFDTGATLEPLGHIAADSITYAMLNAALKPSAGAPAGVETLRALGLGAGKAAAGTHAAQHESGGADVIAVTADMFAAGISGIDYGTALPTVGLFNGYRFTLFVSDGVSNVPHQYMYRADLDGTYPWHLLDGPPLFASASSVVAIGASTVYTDRHGVTLNLDRPGKYVIEYGHTFASGSSPAGEGFSHPSAPSITPADSAAAIAGGSGADNGDSSAGVHIQSQQAAMFAKSFTMTGTETVALVTKGNGVGCSLSRAWLKATPRKVG